MPFQRPTINQITTRVRTDLESRITAGKPALRRSVVFVLSVVIGAAVHLLYGAVSFFSRQIFGDTAEAEFMQRLASIFGVFPKPAGFAFGDLVLSGVNGSVVPLGWHVQRSDGLLYETQAQVTISGGTATVEIMALEAGEDSNTDAGVEMTLVSPVAGVQSAGVVDTGGIRNGVAAEETEDLRARFLDRVRQPPQGGALPDYERWALEVPGVTRAWATPNSMGPGTVGLSFVVDDQDPIIPDSGKVEEVQDYIDEIRPITDELFVFAPAAVPLDFDIEIIPDTPAIRLAIESELRDLIAREAEPSGTLLISHIREAISIAADENDHTLNSPSANVVSDPGDLTTMGTIDWGDE